MFSSRSFATRSRVHAGTLSMRSGILGRHPTAGSRICGPRSGPARRQSSRAHSCCPGERAFGNYELKVTESVTRLSPRSITGQPSRPASLRMSFERRRFSGCVDRPAQWFDPRMWNMAKTPCRLEHLPLLAQSLLDTDAKTMTSKAVQRAFGDVVGVAHESDYAPMDCWMIGIPKILNWDSTIEHQAVEGALRTACPR